jgi:hypothetical protein
MSQTMYEQNVYFPDVFKGCLNGCIYCKPSFQRQAKRQKQRCLKCYSFEPHFHLERLKYPSPKTKEGQFVFFPKGGDVSYCFAANFLEMLKYCEANPQTTFLIQSKNPEYFWSFRYPKNVILGITLESNLSEYHTPSKYHYYHEISIATSPLRRVMDFLIVDHSRKEITIEPILQFDANLIGIIAKIKPEFVYVGYDTKKCKLPEPRLSETLELIERLEREKHLTVRRKTIRKAWYEVQDCDIAGEKKT